MIELEGDGGRVETDVEGVEPAPAIGTAKCARSLRNVRHLSGPCRCSTATAGAFPWTIAASAGINVCLRKVEPTRIFELNQAARRHPHVRRADRLQHTDQRARRAQDHVRQDHIRQGQVGQARGRADRGRRAPVAVLEGAESIGIKLTHVYGLTEVYGPASVCAEQPGWDELPAAERAQFKRRQGVPYPLEEAVSVLDPLTMCEVPRDGETIGEVMFRGNIVMKGYLKNEKATEEAFAGGWFHTGDLGVLDEYGYVIIKDRSKDIIISGGENISSVEVEDILYKHRPCCSQPWSPSPIRSGAKSLAPSSN